MPMPPGRDALDLAERRALASVLRGIGSAAPPVTVGRYEIGPALGKGACGAVFRARDPDLDREVALKIVGGEQPRGDTAQARLLREAQALARVQHPNVVEVYDVGIDAVGLDGRREVYIVMERIEGRTLAEWAQQTSPSPEQIVAAYLDAARGLAAAHREGVVHRDFKPANAMITDVGRVVVLDFGLATAAGEGGSITGTSGEGVAASGRDGDSLTATGVIMGTPRYMAPEQHAAEPATPATDQFAWCVALWEALAGTPPFAGETIAALDVAKQGPAPSPPRSIPPALASVLRRGLAIDPADRFASMQALVEAAEGKPSRRRTWLALGGIGLAVVGLGIASTARPPPPELCVQPFERAASPWGDDAVAELDAELRALDELAPGVSGPTVSRVATFGERWEATRAAACDAADEAPDTATASADCLARARRRFDAALEDLHDGGPGRYPWVAALRGLGSPARCMGEDVASLFVVDGTDAEEVVELRATLEAASAEHRDDVPAERLERALVLSEEIDDHDLAVRALLLRSERWIAEGRYREAAEAATLAVWRAMGAGDDQLAGEVLPRAIEQLIIRAAPAREIDNLLAVADEVMAKLGHPPELTAALDQLRAMALEDRGEYDAALRLYAQTAVRLTADPLPSGEYERAVAYRRLAGLQLSLGHSAAAQHNFTVAYDTMMLRPQDARPAERGRLLLDLSRAAFDAGDLDRAAEAVRDALSTFAEIDGDDSADELATLGWYGFVLGVRGDLPGGRAHLQVAIERLRGVGRGDDWMLLPLYDELAILDLLAGDDASCIEDLQQARRLATDVDSFPAQDVAMTWGLLALAQARAGQLDDAAASLQRAERTAGWTPGDAGLDDGTEARRAIVRARAWLAVAREDWDAAADALQVALADDLLYDGTPMTNGDLAELYELLQRTEAGRGHAEAAAAIGRLAADRRAVADVSRRRARPGA